MKTKEATEWEESERELKTAVASHWGSVASAAEKLLSNGKIRLEELVNTLQQVSEYPREYWEVVKLMEARNLSVSCGEVEAVDFCRVFGGFDENKFYQRCVGELVSLEEEFEDPLDDAVGEDKMRGALIELRRTIKLRWRSTEQAGDFLSHCGGEIGGNGRIGLLTLHSNLVSVGYRRSCAELCVALRALQLVATEMGSISVFDFERIKNLDICYEAADPETSSLVPLLVKMHVRRALMTPLTGMRRIFARVHVFFVFHKAGEPVAGELAAADRFVEALQACVDVLSPVEESPRSGQMCLSGYGARLFIDIITHEGEAKPRIAAVKVLGKAVQLHLAQSGDSEVVRAQLVTTVWRPLLTLFEPDLTPMIAVLRVVFDLFILLKMPLVVAGPRAAKLGAEVVKCLLRLHEAQCSLDVFTSGNSPNFRRICDVFESLELLELRHGELSGQYGKGSYREVCAVFAAFGGCSLLRQSLQKLHTAAQVNSFSASGLESAAVAAVIRGAGILSRWQREHERIMARWPLSPSGDAEFQMYAQKAETLAEVVLLAHNEGFETSWGPPTVADAPPLFIKRLLRQDSFANSSDAEYDDGDNRVYTPKCTSMYTPKAASQANQTSSPESCDEEEEDAVAEGTPPGTPKVEPSPEASPEPSCTGDFPKAVEAEYPNNSFPEGGLEQALIDRVANRSRLESRSRGVEQTPAETPAEQHPDPKLGRTPPQPVRAHTAMSHREMSEQYVFADRSGAQTSLGHWAQSQGLSQQLQSKPFANSTRPPFPLPLPKFPPAAVRGESPGYPLDHSFERPYSSASVSTWGFTSTSASRSKWHGHEIECDVTDMQINYALGRVTKTRKLAPLPQWAKSLPLEPSTPRTRTPEPKSARDIRQMRNAPAKSVVRDSRPLWQGSMARRQHGQKAGAVAIVALGESLEVVCSRA